MHMINLLPQQERLTLAKLRLVRTINILGLGTLVVLFLAGGVFDLLKRQAGASLVETEQNLQALFNDPGVRIVLEADQAVLRFNDLLRLTSSAETGRQSWATLLRLLAQTVPPEVRLTNITSAADSNSVQISGVSETREAMLNFQKALSQVPITEKIEAPFTNFLADSSISFSLTWYLRHP